MGIRGYTKNHTTGELLERRGSDEVTQQRRARFLENGKEKT